MGRIVRTPKRAARSTETYLREAADLMRSLSNPNRLKIASALAEREQSVSELEDTLGIKQPILSQQLAGLREAGIVQARRSSKSVFYSVADANAGHLITALHKIFCGDAPFVPAPLTVPFGPAPGVQAAVFARVSRRSDAH